MSPYAATSSLRLKQADTEEQAMKLAKQDATVINIPGRATDSVTLWVDDDIDVELIPALPSAPGRAP